MRVVLAVPIAVPLALAALGIAVGRRGVRRALSVFGSLAALASGVAIVHGALDGDVAVAQVGAWPGGVAIPLVGDMLAGLMVVAAALLVLLCDIFAMAADEDKHGYFHPLSLVLLAGVCGSFLTGDLFNLFVFFEVMLIASYVLLTIAGTREQIRAGAVYVTTNLLASTLFLAAVAVMYGSAGSVNMAVLAGANARAPGMIVAGALLLIAFGVKAALVPVHGWLPRSYPAASPAVTALLSGLLTKVGVYAMYRVYATVFGGDGRFRMLLLVVAALSMTAGVIGAVGRDGMREILAFHMVSQMGYMVLALGLFGPAGLAAGIFFILHQMVVKTSLFLSAGAVEAMEGSGEIARLGGVARRRPLLALAFIVAALSLAGLPPTSGFFAKLTLIQAAFADADHLVAAVAIVVSLFTLLSMLKIWNGVFWGHGPARPGDVPLPEPGRARAAVLVAPAGTLALIAVAIGLDPHGLYVLSQRAAAHLVDPSAYIKAVLGG